VSAGGIGSGVLAGGPDWGSLGLVLAIAGSFLIASGILLRDPQSLLEERFGQAAPRLRSIREFAFHRVQMALGFLLLIAGFALQLLERARVEPAAGPGTAPAGGSTALWIGGLLALFVALELAGWGWSVLSIRRALRRWLVQHPGLLDADPRLAREVGELFGVASHANDTLQSYVARLRRVLDLPLSAAARPRRDVELVAEERE
jgi:hypothetical protein